jgi:hypothetical protein
VAGYLQHFEANAGNLDHVALTDNAVGRRAGDREAEWRAQVGERVRQHERVAGADDKWCFRERLLQRRVPADMVGVAVRVEDCRRAQAVLLERGQDQRRLQPRVDHERFRVLVSPNNVGILLERERYDRFNPQRGWHDRLSRGGGRPPMNDFSSNPCNLYNARRCGHVLAARRRAVNFLS